MCDQQRRVDRREYLTLAGGAGVATTIGLAGCLEDAENGDGEGDNGGNGDGGQTIVPGTAPGFEPFEMNVDGELVGFDIDLLAAVVEETDYELGEWEEFDFASLIPALQNDRIDVIAAAMTINEERQQTIAFSDPYYNADQAVLVRAGGDFQPSELGDLSGHKVGAQEGTTGADVVEDELIEPGDLEESDFSTYGSYVLAVEDLENENLDAIVIDKPVADTFASSRDVEVAFVHETGERYGFGIRQDADDVQSALNSGLQTVQDDGTYEELTNEWFGE